MANLKDLIVNGSARVLGTLYANITGNVTGNASTATTLQTTRSINGTNFNGSANITTANWGTARNISISDSDGTNTGTAVSVNGSGNATLKLPATIKASITGNCSGSSGSCTGNANTATTATTANKIKVTDHSANNATYYPVWVTGAGASVDAYNTTSKLKFNPSTGVLTSTSFVGSLTGNVTGNASSATKATQDGSGNTITSTYVNLTGTQTISGAKTFSTNPTISSTGINITGGEPVIQKSGINFIRRTDALILSANNNSIIMRPKGDADGTNQATLDNTGNLTAVKFTGSLTGNVTGNCSGSSGSCTGNAATATALQDMNRQPQGSLTNVSGNITIALTRQQMLYRIKPTANITGITLNTTAANLNASYAYTFELIIDMTAGAYTVSIPDSLCKWEGNSKPTINEQKMYMLVFRTMNAGTTWFGSLQGAWSIS